MSCIISPPTQRVSVIIYLEILLVVLEVVQQQAVVQAVSSPRGVAVRDLEDQYVAGRVVVQGRVLIK
jgi:hypothetical protein